MTLSAITGANVLYIPSLAIAKDAEVRDEIVKETRTLSKTVGLFCPHCLYETGQKLSVSFRNSTDRRVHFFHEKLASEDGLKCNSSKGITEKHTNTQAAIQAYYIANFPTCTVKLEVLVRSNPAIAFRRPDVLVLYPNGVLEVHEVQISPISAADLLQRTDDLKKHGVGTVKWYLYGAADSQENRAACFDNGIAIFKLKFSSDDFPSWEEITAPKRISHVASSNAVDGCTKKHSPVITPHQWVASAPLGIDLTTSSVVPWYEQSLRKAFYAPNIKKFVDAGLPPDLMWDLRGASDSAIDTKIKELVEAQSNG